VYDSTGGASGGQLTLGLSLSMSLLFLANVAVC
jgi:hypothetical protein